MSSLLTSSLHRLDTSLAATHKVLCMLVVHEASAIVGACSVSSTQGIMCYGM